MSDPQDDITPMQIVGAWLLLALCLAGFVAWIVAAVEHAKGF